MKLTDREWKSFKIKDIFQIKGGFYNKKPEISGVGTIPFLGATDKNNGVTGFYNLQDIEMSSRTGAGKNDSLDRKLFKGNCICVTNDGSVGYAYYQVQPFTCSHSINPLYLAGKELTKPLALFLIRCIEQQRVCFEYSRKWRPSRMVKSDIMLPITPDSTPDSTPDWNFMEAYIREREEEKIEKYKAYSESVLDGLEYKEVERLGEKDWGIFRIDEIFEVMTGQNIKKDKLKDGLIPRITARDTKNGIDGYYSNQNNSKYVTQKNIVSISFLGSVKYHPYSVSLDMKVHSLKRKDKKEFSSGAGLFLSTNLSREFIKYSYGNQLSSKDLLKARIYLPIDISGLPDWEYMEQYIENMMIRKYEKYNWNNKGIPQRKVKNLNSFNAIKFMILLDTLGKVCIKGLESMSKSINIEKLLKVDNPMLMHQFKKSDYEDVLNSIPSVNLINRNEISVSETNIFTFDRVIQLEIPDSIEEDSVEYAAYEIYAKTFLDKGDRVQIKHKDGGWVDFCGKEFSQEYIDSVCEEIIGKYYIEE